MSIPQLKDRTLENPNKSAQFDSAARFTIHPVDVFSSCAECSFELQDDINLYQSGVNGQAFTFALCDHCTLYFEASDEVTQRRLLHSFVMKQAEGGREHAA